MHHKLPIVAYGATAVPETVLDAGIVLASKSPVLVAAAVQRVLSDPGLRAQLIEAGLERARAFSIEAARRGFATAIERVLQAS
jgi:glycosyltransferase involved in cell wall biosynthesis